jgi:serine/alanine adding enzyme
MTLEVVPSRWDGLLARAGCKDAYYLRGYIESAALARSGRSSYLYLGDEHGAVAFPCIVGEHPELGVRDATTVGYGGPLALGADPPLEQFSHLYGAWCAEHDVVTSFIRFHPLLANYRYAAGAFHLERGEGSVSWPLEGDLFAGMHRHHRRLVRKAEAAGIDVHVSIGPDRLDGFAALYEQTMHRLDAESFYFFPDQYWRLLSGDLGEKLVLFEAKLDGRVVGATLCFATPPWLHYHLGATSDDGRALGASHLLLYSAARFGRERGYEQFHLGSGVGSGGGSLLQFKQRFSPSPLLEQWFGKTVHDVGRYLALTNATTVCYDGFFPAYRTPESGPRQR